MKLTIFKADMNADVDHWELQQLIDHVEAKGIEYNILHIHMLYEYENVVDEIGTHVFQWRTGLIKPVQYGTFLEFLRDKVVINGTQPGGLLNRYKSHQFSMVKKDSDVPVIDTYMIKEPDQVDELIEKGHLSYPFIQKPNYGSKGKGVILVNKKEDLTSLSLELDKTVLQPFIKNDGDFRVLMVGGKVVGMMKRSAGEGKIVNNFSQGGSVEVVTDKKIIKRLTELADKVYKVFGYGFCGLDFVYDVEIDDYRFMELNARPGWRGFYKATGIKLEEKIVETYLTK